MLGTISLTIAKVIPYFELTNNNTTFFTLLYHFFALSIYFALSIVGTSKSGLVITTKSLYNNIADFMPYLWHFL